MDDKNTDTFFLSLINSGQADYSRYFFLFNYLIENRVDDAKIIVNDLDYINTSLLLSQGKVG